MKTRIFLIATIIIGVTGCGDDIEGTSCKDPGAIKVSSKGNRYICSYIEPTRPKDGMIWKKVK